MTIVPQHTATSIESVVKRLRDAHTPAAIGALKVEPLIEFEMKMFIRPINGLYRRRKVYGYLACDGRTIVVDEDFQNGDEQEYEALLRHELGHAVLHRPLLPFTGALRTSAEFAAFHRRLTSDLYPRLEWEARYFGSSLQMPLGELESVFWRAMTAGLLRFGAISGATEVAVEEAVADHFNVSPTRAHRRLEDAGLWELARRRVERGGGLFARQDSDRQQRERGMA